MSPHSLLRPRDECEVADMVQSLASQKSHVEIIGGGSKRAIGQPSQATTGLDMGCFSGVIDYEPAELVLTVGTATPVAEVRALLAASGQHIACEPLDLSRLALTPGQPASNGEGTMGGLVSSNLAGPRRMVAGAVRDSFLGVRGISGTGEVFKAGGKVVKNVTGFDLCKLLAGSWGTLVAMTEISLKVLPKPEAMRTLTLHGLSDTQAIAAMAKAMSTPYEVTGAAHFPRGAVTVLRLEGSGPGVVARAALLAAVLAEFGVADISADESVWHDLRSPAFNPTDWPVWRVSVPPFSAVAVAEGVRARLPDVVVVYDWAGGLLWLAVPPAEDGQAAMVRTALATAGGGGHATLIRASAEVRARVAVFQPPSPTLVTLSQRVKESYDPGNIFNRNRIVRGL